MLKAARVGRECLRTLDAALNLGVERAGEIVAIAAQAVVAQAGQRRSAASHSVCSAWCVSISQASSGESCADSIAPAQQGRDGAGVGRAKQRREERRGVARAFEVQRHAHAGALEMAPQLRRCTAISRP